MIRALVSYTNVSASVTYVEQANLTLAQPKLATSSTWAKITSSVNWANPVSLATWSNATALLDWQRLSFGNVVLNPSTLNKYLSDNLALTDELVIELVEVYVRSFSDTYTFVDTTTHSVDKGQYEPVSIADSLILYFTYNRTFNDAFTLDDLANVGDFVKDTVFDKDNITSVTDNIVVSVSAEQFSLFNKDVFNMFKFNE
jgi:hypothetical protein